MYKQFYISFKIILTVDFWLSIYKAYIVMSYFSENG